MLNYSSSYVYNTKEKDIEDIVSTNNISNIYKKKYFNSRKR